MISVKASEGLLDDDILYVTVQGATIGIKGGRIIVHANDEDVSYPINKVTTVNVFGNIGVTTPLIALAGKYGIIINYFNSFGRYRGSFMPEKNTIVAIRRAQCSLSESVRLKLAKTIVVGKIRNSIYLLEKRGVKCEDRLHDTVADAMVASSFDVLLGHEGEAAALYFKHLNLCLSEDWSFEKRTKQPPQDHTNSLMSLTYVMIKNEVFSALRQYNLDPYVGIMHADRHGKPSLALDLMEEFRSIFCDSFVLRLVNRKELHHEDFKLNNHLKEYAFKTYLSKFDDYMKEELKKER